MYHMGCLCRQLIKLVAKSEAGILLTSYDQLRLQRAELLAVSWGYAILDEGHKIRNPDAEVMLGLLPFTFACFMHVVLVVLASIDRY